MPKNLEVHIIVDNYATHKHLRVRRWFAARPRFHVHFTPTYASWINQMEIWFNHHPTSHSAGNVRERERTGRQNRTVREEFQPALTTVRLDRHGGFDSR